MLRGLPNKGCEFERERERVKHECKGVRFLESSPPAVVGEGMGDRRSFRIESKRFDLTWVNDGTKQVRISEKGSYHRSIIHMGKEGTRWLGRCMEENITREGEKAFIRTLREHGKTFIIRRYSNKYGRYIEVQECGMGGSRERIVIPEGQQHNGWKGFRKELNLLLNPEPRTNNHQLQGRDDRIGGTAMGKHARRVEGPSKSYKEAVSRGARVAANRENMPKDKATEKMKDRTRTVPVTTVSEVEGKSGARSGINVTTEKTEQIRQPLRFFPEAAPVIPRNLGTGITIHINETGQRQVTWTTKGNTKLEKQWVPRTRNEDSQQLDSVFINGPKETQGDKGFGPRSIYEVGESSGSKQQMRDLMGPERPIISGPNLVGSSNTWAHKTHGLPKSHLTESSVMLTGRGADHLSVDWNLVEIYTNREQNSEVPVRRTFLFDVRPQQSLRLTAEETILIQMARMVRESEKTAPP